MDIFLCQTRKWEVQTAIVNGENRADAVLKLDSHICGAENQRMTIDLNHDGNTNAFCEVLLAEYDVTELHRHDVLEWVERKLDGAPVLILLE